MSDAKYKQVTLLLNKEDIGIQKENTEPHTRMTNITSKRRKNIETVLHFGINGLVKNKKGLVRASLSQLNLAASKLKY